MTNAPTTANCRPAFNELIRSKKPPVDLQIPAEILGLFDTVHASETKYGRQVSSGFLFGSAMIAYSHGSSPRDIDLTICSPDLVRAVKVHTDTISPHQTLGAVFGYGHTLRPDPDSISRVEEQPLFGECFQVTCTYGSPMKTVDLLVSSNPVDAAQFFATYGVAPIKSMAYDPVRKQYVYDRQFAEDLTRWRYRPYDGIDDPNMHSKAERDGMELAKVA